MANPAEARLRLADLTGRRVVLLGLGADVTAALGAVLGASPAEVRVVDDGDGGIAGSTGSAGSATAPAATAELVMTDLDSAAGWAEVFVRSPGFPRYRPPLVAALERGASMTTPLDLWMGTAGTDRTVVGITGTKGKSTVTELVGRLAVAHGVRVGVAGNLGPPVFGPGWDHESRVVALEVSSYQAADLHHVPDIAAIPYLSEDHLSWHGSRQAYVADKLRMLRNEGGTAGTILLAEGAGRAREAVEAMGLEVVEVPAPRAPAEVPAHRVANAALAAAVVERIGGPSLDGEQVVEAARSSLPGRLDRCAGPGQLLCIDDALASNPSAAAAALAWLRGLNRPTVVLLGGADRGVDLAPLAEEAARWSGGRLVAVALPDTGAATATACGIALAGEAGSVEEAVAIAVACSAADGAILFSPAAPTPAAVGNWETRSGQFRQALRSLSAAG